jgi:uncharacterized DUF497 family protein
MFDLSLVRGFDWDDGNRLKSANKHSVSMAEAEQVFADSGLLLAEDVKHSQAEARYHAMGRTADGWPLHATFALRGNGTRVRVISARDMKRKERAVDEQEEA